MEELLVAADDDGVVRAAEGTGKNGPIVTSLHVPACIKKAATGDALK